MLVGRLMSRPSEWTFHHPGGKTGKSIVNISDDLIVAIKRRRPDTLGIGDPISLIVEPDFDGGEAVSLRLTPDWRRPYRAVITVSPSSILAQVQ